MFKIIKNFKWIILSSFLCFLLGIFTFLTFIDQSFIPLTNINLQTLLILDIILLLFFFYLIFRNVLRIYTAQKKSKIGSKTNIKYISLFSLFTFIPSLVVAIFSLFLFNFGIQNFFNDKIKLAVNNSYDVAKNYLEDSKRSIEGDILIMSVGINRVSDLFYSNPTRFGSILWSEKILRKIDDVYLIDSSGTIIFSDTKKVDSKFIIPVEENFKKASEGTPVILINNFNSKSSAMVKIPNLIDTYLYISRNIDPKILNYLNETKQAVNYYYSVESKQAGIKLTFAIIYIIIVTLLLFLSTFIAISFATRLTKPIVNLIKASEDISKGELDTKVKEDETDEEFKILNKNFNNMINKLKKQQDKLLLSERYSAWESVARKLAHEIKNPLTPIQLSIDSLQEKYSKKISSGQKDFISYLETINRQIKDIENLVNEFSSFARMPSPIIRKINIFNVVNRAVNFMLMSSKTEIVLLKNNKNLFINGDEEQLYRVFINLIKNSLESIDEIQAKKANFKGKIDVDIATDNEYIDIKIRDNGTGIINTKKIMTPYYTTKKNGTGLGLPIVNKIISEHSGDFSINQKESGAEVIISLPPINEK
jgi:two-component system, NtrC family, nitrogen regulation sensor histidine kinase NtrY